VSLTYHKFNNSVSCHYCGWHSRFEPGCKHCGSGTYVAKGAGTEKLAEELQELFPDARIARFDAETAASRTAEKQILGDFESGATDILVGTQMITKGFDFEKLSLVAVINADSILSLQDFRADEKALQLLTQLRGRVSRREGTGQMAVQAFKTDHPVLKALSENDTAGIRSDMLSQRKLFGFAPYVRMVLITLKNSDPTELRRSCELMERKLSGVSALEFTPAIAPAVDKVAGKYIRNIWLKLPRKGRAQTQKSAIEQVAATVQREFSNTDIIIDVDPL